MIVHRKTAGKTRPGPGFLALAESLGLTWEEGEEDAFVEREMERVYARQDA